jgi:hypothetical protein
MARPNGPAVAPSPKNVVCHNTSDTPHQHKTHVRMVNFGNIKNRAIRKLGDKAVAALGGAADRTLGKKGGSVARAALQEAQAQYLPGTAGIPGWVPKGAPPPTPTYARCRRSTETESRTTRRHAPRTWSIATSRRTLG